MNSIKTNQIEQARRMIAIKAIANEVVCCSNLVCNAVFFGTGVSVVGAGQQWVGLSSTPTSLMGEVILVIRR
jgi:hypothetical protein